MSVESGVSDTRYNNASTASGDQSNSQSNAKPASNGDPGSASNRISNSSFGGLTDGLPNGPARGTSTTASIVQPDSHSDGVPKPASTKATSSASSGAYSNANTPTWSGISKFAKVPVGDLPASSYDGSHLPWAMFRSQVLAPHRIQVVESAPKERVPDVLLTMIEAVKDTSQFDSQKSSYRTQVSSGRGFGLSPIFPPNLLPPIDAESKLTRCMVPNFSREALPERVLNRLHPLYELSVPRPTLDCGFSSHALSNEEISVIPSFLVTTGTIVNYDTGYIAPGAASYCPFLTFERTYGSSEHRLESAHNQCAIGGAWSVRALELLYTKAWGGEMMPELPVTFSCALDDNLAIINLHWIDHGLAYCSSPLCKFDLSKDDQFTQFLVWIDCIGKWAVARLLPVIKQALARLASQDITPTAPRNPKLSLTTNTGPDELLIRSLKTTFDDIPWRFEDDELAAVSSTTASRGSPINMDTINFPFTSLVNPEGSADALNMSWKSLIPPLVTLTTVQQTTPPPPDAMNSDLELQKRLKHAMDEIQDLQRQQATMKKELESADIQARKEMTSLRSMLCTVLRKEALGVKLDMNMLISGSRSPYPGGLETWYLLSQQQQTFCPPGYQKLGSPIASPLCRPRQPTPLELDKRPANASTTAVTEAKRDEHIKKTVIFVDDRNIPNYSSNGNVSEGLLTPPPTARIAPTISIQSPLSPRGLPSPTFSIMSNSDTNIVVVPPPPASLLQESRLWKLATLVLSGFLAANIIPVAFLQAMASACVVNLCLLVFVSEHYPSGIERPGDLLRR